MALPTPIDLDTLDFAANGQPFCDVPAKSSIIMDGLDYAKNAQPFNSNPVGGESPKTNSFGYIF